MGFSLKNRYLAQCFEKSVNLLQPAIMFLWSIPARWIFAQSNSPGQGNKGGVQRLQAISREPKDFEKLPLLFIWYLYKTSFDLIVVEADGSKWEGREGVRQCSAERVPPRLRSKLLLKISLSTFISWSTTRRSYKSLLMQWIAGERQAGVDRTSNQSPTPTDSAILSTASSATSGTSSALSLGAKARISIGVILGVGCVVLAVV